MYFVKKKIAKRGGTMFKRKIYDKLVEWKNESQGRTALMIEGARRVGKRTTAEEFARNEYDDYILLDFALETKDLRRNFEDNIGDLDTFFRNLFIINGKVHLESVRLFCLFCLHIYSFELYK